MPDSSVVRESLMAFSMQALHYAILLLDDAGVIVWASPGAERILDATDLPGNSVARCFPTEDVDAGVPEFELEVAGTRGWVEDDRWMQRSDGSRFWAEGMTVGIRDQAGMPMGFIKLFRNRTQQKMANETLRNKIAEANVQFDAQNTLIATVAHELRTPLSAIQNCTHVLATVPPNDARAERAMEILTRNATFSVRLVNELVDAERGALGKLVLKPEMVSVEDALRTAMQAAQLGVERSHRKIDLIVPAEGVQIEADPLRMQQIFVNLINNAIRYTPDDGQIWITAVTQGDAIVVKVEDNGYGIDPAELKEIFELFSQASNAHGKGGLGVGLALVKQIVELHQGTVQAQSDGVGKGSQFFVRLPLRQPNDGKPADG